MIIGLYVITNEETGFPVWAGWARNTYEALSSASEIEQQPLEVFVADHYIELFKEKEVENDWTSM